MFYQKMQITFCFKKNSTLQTKELIKNRSDVKDLSGKLIDFSDTAAACVNMDLIITVDTAVAHLAGAHLAVPQMCFFTINQIGAGA